jgi:hypothetical protein
VMVKFDVVDEAGFTRYKGFTNRWYPAMMVGGGFLVMVAVEDVYEQWYVENMKGIEKLREYYDTEYGIDPPMCSLVIHGTHQRGLHDLDF